MNKSLGAFIVVIPFALSFASVAQAQPQAPAQPEKIPVKLQFVISKFEGDRKVSSVPYTLLATANGGQVTLLSGINVPIPNGSGTFSYTNVGTVMVCTVTTEGGNFKIEINFDDKSVVAAKTPVAAAGTPSRPPESPSFRDVNFVGTITIKDGETKLLISAPDKSTGELIKVDLTLTLDPPRRASIGTNARDVAALEIPLSLN